jgi:hypothetical protein
MQRPFVSAAEKIRLPWRETNADADAANRRGRRFDDVDRKLRRKVEAAA